VVELKTINLFVERFFLVIGLVFLESAQRLVAAPAQMKLTQKTITQTLVQRKLRLDAKTKTWS
jgi:hypothetical protein